MSKWRKYNGALIPNVPPDEQIDVSNIDHLIREKKVYLARWISDFDCNKETQFWFVINDTPLSIDAYSRNTRSKIRRGLKNCDVREISKQELIEKGYPTYVSALESYRKKNEIVSLEEFNKQISSMGSEWDFWGIFYKNLLIGYSQNKIIGDYCDYSTIKFHPNYLKFYPSYALFYTMNNFYLNKQGFRFVNDGARSISHETNIQNFLIDKFKFRKAYCRMHVRYSLKMSIVIRLLYYLRFLFICRNPIFFKKINSLLIQEEIRRSYE